MTTGGSSNSNATKLALACFVTSDILAEGVIFIGLPIIFVGLFFVYVYSPPPILSIPLSACAAFAGSSIYNFTLSYKKATLLQTIKRSAFTVQDNGDGTYLIKGTSPIEGTRMPRSVDVSSLALRIFNSL